MDYNKLNKTIPESVIGQIPDAIARFEVNTPLRLSHFLTQCIYESGHFRYTEEKLDYSASGLRGIFPTYFKTDEIARQYQRNPEKVANYIYGGEFGNGPDSTGDGWRFRGRGYILIHGRTNYTNFSKAINEDLTLRPDLVATKYPLLSAAWFFNSNGINQIADRGDSIDAITMVSKRVNGAVFQMEERIKKFRELYGILQ